MSIFSLKKTPLRIQSDPLECGAVCLGIILQYFGRYESTKVLKERAQVSRMGSDAKNLIDAAASFQLESKAHRCSASDLKHIKSLGILFFDQCHFVVYEGFFRGKYYINDPGFGRYALAEKVFRRRFCGVIIELAKNPHFQKSSHKTKAAFSWLSNPFFYSMAMLGAFGGLLLAASFMLLGYLLANSVAQDSEAVFYFLWVLLAILGASFFILFPLWKRIANIANRSSDREEQEILSNVARVPLDFFEDRPFAAFKNAYAGMFARQMERWQALLLRVWYFPIIAALLLFLVVNSLKIFLLAFFLCVFFLVSKYLCAIKIAPVQFAKKNQQEKLSAAQEKAFSMAKDMSAMGQNDMLVGPIMQAEIALVQEDGRNQAIAFFDKYLVYIFLALFWLKFSFLVSSLIGANGYHLNEIIASLIAGSFLLLFVDSYLANFVTDNSDSAFSASFLRDLQDYSVPAPQNPMLENGSLVSGSFSHTFAQSKSPLFSQAQLAIHRGKIYGLVGAPLSGKSTLLKIIARKLTPSTNGLHWAANGDHKPLKIGLIDGDSDVYLGTLRDNVSLWDEKRTEEEIAQALSLACVEELFFNRPLGLLSPILAHGGNVSGGQKKRLMLARALLMKPDLLILDNFFETLDSERAKNILRNIANLNISCIFNTYDREYLKIVHEVIFLDMGKVRLGESHEDLLKQSASYQELICADDSGGP